MKKFIGIFCMLLVFGCAHWQSKPDQQYITRAELTGILAKTESKQEKMSVAEILKLMEGSATAARAYTGYEGTGTGKLGKTACSSLSTGDQAWVQTSTDTAFYYFDATDTTVEDAVNKTYIHCYDASWSAGNWIKTNIRGLVIGTNVQAYDVDLADLADGSLTGSKVGTGISATNITTGTLPDARIPDKVTGPASSTDNEIPRFDSTTGKLLQGSGVTMGDAGNFNPSDTPGFGGYCTSEASDIWQITSSRDGSNDATVDFDVWINGSLVELLSLDGAANSGSGAVILGKPVTAPSIDAPPEYYSQSSNVDLDTTYPDKCDLSLILTLGVEVELWDDSECGTTGFGRRLRLLHRAATNTIGIDPDSTDTILADGLGLSLDAGDKIQTNDLGTFIELRGRDGGEYWDVWDCGPTCTDWTDGGP